MRGNASTSRFVVQGDRNSELLGDRKEGKGGRRGGNWEREPLVGNAVSYVYQKRYLQRLRTTEIKQAGKHDRPIDMDKYAKGKVKVTKAEDKRKEEKETCMQKESLLFTAEGECLKNEDVQEYLYVKRIRNRKSYRMYAKEKITLEKMSGSRQET